MFTGWTAEQLFSASSKAGGTPSGRPDSQPAGGQNEGYGLAGVQAIFSTRSEFSAALPPHRLFDDAHSIEAAGLSLNLLCQQYPVRKLKGKLLRGDTVCCLFLDPNGRAIQEREKEEGYGQGELSSLTDLNLQTLLRARSALHDDLRGNFRIGVYDETIRYNIMIIDESRCVVQPYLPNARGVDSPTFLAERDREDGAVFNIFSDIIAGLKDRSNFL
jgi:hypothetical protein